MHKVECRVPGHLISGVAALMGRHRRIEVRDRDSMTLGGVPASLIIIGLTLGISMSVLSHIHVSKWLKIKC